MSNTTSSWLNAFPFALIGTILRHRSLTIQFVTQLDTSLPHSWVIFIRLYSTSAMHRMKIVCEPQISRTTSNSLKWGHLLEKKCPMIIRRWKCDDELRCFVYFSIRHVLTHTHLLLPMDWHETDEFKVNIRRKFL